MKLLLGELLYEYLYETCGLKFYQAFLCSVFDAVRSFIGIERKYSTRGKHPLKNDGNRQVGNFLMEEMPFLSWLEPSELFEESHKN